MAFPAQAFLPRSAYLWLSPRHWRKRLTFWLGAVLVGIAAALFARAADVSQDLFVALRGWSVWGASATTVVGFVVCAEITRRFAPGARGSGIPQAIAARRKTSLIDRDRLVGARVTLLKVVLTLVGLAAGAAIGREGPTVQVGACLMFLVGRYAGLNQRSGLVLAGAAAGVAGAFNTPLAGIVFAIEELAKSYERRVSGLVIAAVVIAGVTSVALIGNYHYFGAPKATFASNWDWAAVPVCALVGGICGGAFSRGVVHFALPKSRLARALRARPVLLALGCGAVVALLGLATQGYANGTSYLETRHALEGGGLLPWWYGFAKLGATLLSSISGIPGGLFSPSLSVGAGLGQWVGGLMPGISMTVVMMLMMAAYFAAVVQAPLTAFVIVTEMTADTTMTLPLLMTTFLAAGVSRLICRMPLYHELSRTF